MDELVVYISDIPDGYSAFKLKLFLNNLLGSGQAVQEIKPSDKDSVMEVHFKEVTYKYVAMAKSPLPLKFGIETYQLVVTTNKPGSEKQASSNSGEYFTPRRHSTTQDEPSTEYSAPSMARAQSEGNFTDYTMQDRGNYSGQPAQQRRIYCYGVGPHICGNKPLIRKHMQQYGHVEDIWVYPNARRPFFKVLFKLHESARTALDHGSNITSVDKLRMQWDRDEANELLQGPQPNYNPPNQARGPQYRYDPQRDPYDRNKPPRSPQYRNSPPQDPQGYNPPRQGQVRLRNPSNQRPRDNRRHSANIEGARQDRRQHPRSDQRRAGDQRRDARRSSDQSAPVASAAPRSWEEIWGSEEDLKKMADNCVLVQNVPDKTSNQSLELYFENTSRSGGGEVFMLCKLRDGILVVFYEQQVARNVCGKQEHYFEGQKLQVFPKTIPTMMKEQFIVSGVDDTKTSKDVLELFIESCSTNHLVPSNVNKMSQGKYMVSYDGPVRDKDIEEIMNNIQQKKLEDKTLEASKMCKSDCIKVANVSNEISDDTIKLTFESKRRTDGGQVTYVQRYKEHVLVYFSDFKVAERVVKTCTDNPLTLDSKHVKVTPHYHSVGAASNAKKRNRKAKGSSSSSSCQGALPGAPVISFKITVKPENIAVVQLIRNSKKILQHFVDEYEDLAQVNFTQPREAKSIIGLMVQPLEKPNEKYMNDQAKFESECKRRYGTYLRKFITTITHMDSKILKGVRVSKGWNENEQVVAIDAEVDVFVRWNHKRQGNIEITCRQGDVETAKEFFKSRSKCVKESVPLKEIHFRAFVDCCIIDDLRETFKQRVDFLGENNAIHLSGNQYDVAEAKNVVLTKQISLDSCKLPGFPSQLTMFMVHSLNAADTNKLQHGSINLRLIIQEEFRQRNIKVSVQVQDDNIQLLYLDTTHRDKATTELSNLLKQVSIPCNESMDAMLQQHEWKRMRQGLCSNKNLRIIQNSHQNEIILLGLAGPFKGAQRNIEGFIRENISGTNLVRMEYISAKFVENYFKDSLEKSSKGVMACVRWGISDGGGIEVKGKDVDVKRAVSWLQGIIGSIKTKPHHFNTTGIPAFFRDKDKSKTFLSFTEKENKCIIMVDTCTLPSWGNPYAHIGNKLKPKVALKTMQCMRLQGSNVEVKILRGDITEVNCDAIVNASNDKLELRDAGISGSIKKKCGHTVQAEMYQHVASVGGTMLPGSAVSTSAGGMNCKRIIHVVGPVWKSDISDEVCEAYLKSCVSETLREAERHHLTSVAMPAISCGIFGGSSSVCPRLMVETLVDHFIDHFKPSSCIKQIYLVENSNNEVIQSFTRSLQSYSNSPPQSATTPQPIVIPTVTPVSSNRGNEFKARRCYHCGRMSPWARHLTAIGPTQWSLMGCPNYQPNSSNDCFEYIGHVFKCLN
ncbi:protein mono-ADP-ribosyltransferase PARP14-like [Ciona intestinalis]